VPCSCGVPCAALPLVSVALWTSCPVSSPSWALRS
jgi:hypothetical protein